LAVPQTVHHILAWSHWRRWPQGLAQSDHYKRRDALAEAFCHLVLTEANARLLADWLLDEYWP
jgi:hypothetical protein